MLWGIQKFVHELAQMEKFDFFCGVELVRKLLYVVDNLSRTLRATAISACEAQFDMFWTSKSFSIVSNTSTIQKDTQDDTKLEEACLSIQKQSKIAIKGFTLKQLIL